MNYQERVERLESENRRLKRIGIVAACLMAIGAGLGFVQNEDTAQLVKNRQAKIRLSLLNQITTGQDTTQIMQQLINNARNGDTEATRTLLTIVFEGDLD